MVHNLPPFMVHSNDRSVVYTHKSLRQTLPDSPGHTLAFLGEKLMNFAIVRHWYEKSPGISLQQLQEKQEKSLSDDLLERCIANYELHQKLARDAEDISVEDCRDFLNTYVGALFVQDGVSGVQQWVSALIDSEVEFPSSAIDAATIQLPASPASSGAVIPSPGSFTTMMLSPSPSTQMLPPYTPSANDNDDLSYVTLSLFNEYATQKQNHTVSWKGSHSGDAHRLFWTVSCLLDGEVKGTGIATSQKVAKEKAVREAWKAMGWSRNTMGSVAGPSGAANTLQSPSRTLSPLIPSVIPLPNFSTLSMSGSGGNGLDFVTLSRFNELAAQRGHRVEWQTMSTGQPHMPTWRVTCIVDGRSTGIGSGKNTKEAKLQAVRDAWKNLRW